MNFSSSAARLQQIEVSHFRLTLGRESLEDRAGQPCRVYEVLPEERTAICEFALGCPKIGYASNSMRLNSGGWTVLDIVR